MTVSAKVKSIIILFVVTVFFMHCYNSPDVKDVKEVVAELDGTKIEILNEKDAKVLESAYEEGLFEMRLADTAKAYAVFDKTKQLAMTLSDLHSDLNAELVSIAGQRSVVLPGDIKPTQLQTLNKMSKIKGTALDKAYIDTALDRYKTNVDLYRNYIKDCNDSALIACFKTATPLFQRYMDWAVVTAAKK